MAVVHLSASTEGSIVPVNDIKKQVFTGKKWGSNSAKITKNTETGMLYSYMKLGGHLQESKGVSKASSYRPTQNRCPCRQWLRDL